MIITRDILDKNVPSEMFPTRLDSALNLYVCVNEGLVVYNVNPETWNCLYPFFEMNHKFTVDEYEFEKKDMTYRELIERYQQEYRSRYEKDLEVTKDVRKKILLEEFEKTFNVDGAVISDELEPVYELKYSKTKNVWTLYYFENYCLGYVNDMEMLLKQKVYEQKFMPLDKSVLEIDGVSVVSNLPYILSDNENIEKLRKNVLNSNKN